MDGREDNLQQPPIRWNDDPQWLRAVFIIIGITLVVAILILILRASRRGGALFALAAAAPVAAAASRLERRIHPKKLNTGLDEMESEGVRLGRPLITVKSEDVSVLKQQGLSLLQIAERLNCSISTVKRRLKGTFGG